MRTCSYACNMKVPALTILTFAVSFSLAGRAFPQTSKIYATKLFQGIQPNIEWDDSNYLVDLSGYHAQCKYATVYNGVSFESTRTRNGEMVTVIQDSGEGKETHVDAVNSYIMRMLESWTVRYSAHIRKAEHFGCSVQPGCRGRVSIACIFSPSLTRFDIPPDEWEREIFIPPEEWQQGPGADSRVAPLPNPKARAFTSQQYELAEEITGTQWDRSHFLENLSAYNISCSAMLAEGGVSFANAEMLAGREGMSIHGVYGYAENNGDTEEALVTILKDLQRPPSSDMVGCSLIADCMKDSQMYVVTSCIYST